MGRSTSGATELAASAEQMTKMSRNLLGTMDRFVLDLDNGKGTGSKGGNGRNGHGTGRRSEAESLPAEAARYAASARS